MVQTVILAGKLVARGGELGLFGALGIAFGPGRDEHRVQRSDVVRKRPGSRVHAPIGPCNQRLVASRTKGESIGRSSPGYLGSRNPRRVDPSPIEPVK